MKLVFVALTALLSLASATDDAESNFVTIRKAPGVQPPTGAGSSGQRALRKHSAMNHDNGGHPHPAKARTGKHKRPANAHHKKKHHHNNNDNAAASVGVSGGVDDEPETALANLPNVPDIDVFNCPRGSLAVEVFIETDFWGEETAIYLTQPFDDYDILFSQPVGSMGSYENYSYQECLAANDCYDIDIFDTNGDGMTGSGYIELWVNNRPRLQVDTDDTTFKHDGMWFGDCI